MAKQEFKSKKVQSLVERTVKMAKDLLWERSGPEVRGEFLAKAIANVKYEDKCDKQQELGIKNCINCDVEILERFKNVPVCSEECYNQVDRT